MDRLQVIIDEKIPFGFAKGGFVPFEIWVVQHNGDITRLPYKDLAPSMGNNRNRLVLNAWPHCMVIVQGRNLVPVLEAVQNNRCVYMYECGPEMGQRISSELPWIDTIRVEWMANYSSTIH